MFHGKESKWKEDKTWCYFWRLSEIICSCSCSWSCSCSCSCCFCCALLLLSLSWWSFVVPCICQAARWLIRVPQGMKQPSSGITCEVHDLMCLENWDVSWTNGTSYEIQCSKDWNWTELNLKGYFFCFTFGFLSFAAWFLAASAVSRSAGDVVLILLTKLFLCPSFSYSADQQSGLERNL